MISWETSSQWQTEWLRSIGDDQWSPKNHGNRSQLSTNQQGTTQGLDALPGMPVYAGVTSGHPAIGSPWSCWGIRDRGVKWCEKRETWGAQLVARLHKILTCKKKWRSRLIDCICCIMLHIFIYVWLCLSNSIDAHDVIKTAKKYRIHETSSPSVAAQVLQVPRGGSSLRLMGWQVNEGDKHAGDWLIVSSTLNWRYDIFASQFQYWLQDVSGVFIKFSIHIGCQKTKKRTELPF